MAYQTAIRTPQELVMDALLDGNLGDTVRHHGHVIVDATAAAVPLNLAGDFESNLAIPVRSGILLQTKLIAYDITNDRNVVIDQLDHFQRAANGTIASLDLTGGDNVALVPGGETIAWGSDNTTGELTLNFTGGASTEYVVNALSQFVFSGYNYRNPTLNTINT